MPKTHREQHFAVFLEQLCQTTVDPDRIEVRDCSDPARSDRVFVGCEPRSGEGLVLNNKVAKNAPGKAIRVSPA
jgi:hypothetical protein